MGIGFHVPSRLFTVSCCLACLFWPCCVTGYKERSSLSKIVAKVEFDSPKKCFKENVAGHVRFRKKRTWYTW